MVTTLNDPSGVESVQLAWSVCYDGTGLRGYVQFSKYIHTHTQDGLRRSRSRSMSPSSDSLETFVIAMFIDPLLGEPI